MDHHHHCCTFSSTLSFFPCFSSSRVLSPPPNQQWHSRHVSMAPDENLPFSQLEWMLEAEQKSCTLAGHVNLRWMLLTMSMPAESRACGCFAGRARARAGRRMKRDAIWFFLVSFPHVSNLVEWVFSTLPSWLKVCDASTCFWVYVGMYVCMFRVIRRIAWGWTKKLFRDRSSKHRIKKEEGNERVLYHTFSRLFKKRSVGIKRIGSDGQKKEAGQLNPFKYPHAP